MMYGMKELSNSASKQSVFFIYQMLLYLPHVHLAYVSSMGMKLLRSTEKQGHLPQMQIHSVGDSGPISSFQSIIYIAGIATQWRLFLWGAKINRFVAKGQVWRLLTCAFLHSNIVHLMVNCYSLNSVGPAMEENIGPGRFLAVYFTSAIAGSAMSYRFCSSPTVGASGALFGLVGSLAVFVSRHKEMFGGGKEYLQRIAYIITINMVIGLLYKRIDNWAHLGGLLGGGAVSWLIGPAWKYESLSSDGRKFFVDRAPMYHLRDPKRARRSFLN